MGGRRIPGKTRLAVPPGGAWMGEPGPSWTAGESRPGGPGSTVSRRKWNCPRGGTGTNKRSFPRRPQYQLSARKVPQVGPGNGGLNILNKPVALRPGAGEPQTERHSVHSSIGPQHRLLAGDAPSIGAHGTSFLAGASPAPPRRGKRQARFQASRTAALPNLGPRRQHKSSESSQISARAGFICPARSRGPP